MVLVSEICLAIELFPTFFKNRQKNGIDDVTLLNCLNLPLKKSQLLNSLLKHDFTSKQIVLYVLDDSFILFKKVFMSHERIEKKHLDLQKACNCKKSPTSEFQKLYIRKKHLENYVTQKFIPFKHIKPQFSSKFLIYMACKGRKALRARGHVSKKSHEACNLACSMVLSIFI